MGLEDNKPELGSDGVSAEQYTGFVIIPQYYFPIPSNFLNTAVP